MEMSLLITQQILKMFFMIAVGVILKRTKVIESEAGAYLSGIALNVALPCAIINAFQIEYSESIKKGLVLAFILAVIFNLILIILPHILKKWLKLNAIEQASLSYPNSGEILIPLVVSILSKEMQIYCCAFLIVQIFFLFTHGDLLISGQPKLRFKNVLGNVNVIAVAIALIIFKFRIPLPGVMTGVIDSFSKMLAPMCMLAIGISIGNCNLREIFSDRRIYLICFLRLIGFPLFILFLIQISGIKNLMDNAKDIILILFMATASSASATVTNMAYYFKNNEKKASLINVMSVLFLIVTLPLMILLYQNII